jgi:CspA family cold shock protein
MHTGTVKWFNDARGFGFIISEQVPSDVFVHYKQIQMDGFRTLKDGQTVMFTLSSTDKGHCAEQVTVVEEK